MRHGSSTFGSKGALPPPPPKPPPGASCIKQQDVYGTVSNHLSLSPIASVDDLNSCDKWSLSLNGTLVGKNLGVYMDDTPANRNGVSGMPPRRAPCLAARDEIPPLLAGPLQIWAKPQANGAVAVLAIHFGQMESKAAHSNQSVTIDFGDVPWLDSSKLYTVRDLHSHKDLAGHAKGEYKLDAELAPISSRMLLLAPLQ